MDFNFTVNEQEANIILQSLGEVPAKISMGLIAKLQKQASEASEAITED